MPELPLFPTLPYTYEMNKKPSFATTLITPPSGRDVGSYQQVDPYWEFNLKFEVLREQTANQSIVHQVAGQMDIQNLFGLFADCLGLGACFAYEDPDDNSRSAQFIGTGDGTTDSFLFYRTWGTGALALLEPVGVVDVRLGKALTIYVNAVPLAQSGNWWIDTDLRTLRFVVPPTLGATISADFSFLYLCRFLDEKLEPEEFFRGYWSMSTLRFRSTTPNGPNNLTTYTIANQNTALTTPQ